MERWGWATNLISGSSLPLLYSLEATGGGWGSVAMVLLGGLGAMLATRAGPAAGGAGTLDECARLGSGLVEVCLSGATIFSLAAGIDSDTGAQLCAIPLFHAVCMHGTSDPQYRRHTRAVVSLLGMGMLGYSAFISLNDAGVGAPGDRMPEKGVAVLTLLNAAYACSGGSLSSIAGRAAVYASLAAQPWPLGPLLRQQQGWGLFAAQTAMLTHSMLVHAGEARLSIEAIRRAISAEEGTRVSRAQRTLILCMAPTLAASFAFQWRSWVGGLCVVGAVQGGWVLLWVYKGAW
jgi:hypothetical protein